MRQWWRWHDSSQSVPLRSQGVHEIDRHQSRKAESFHVRITNDANDSSEGHTVVSSNVRRQQQRD